MSGISPEQRQREATSLRRIRSQVAGIHQGTWLLTADGAGMFVQVRAPGGELLTLARFEKSALPEELELFAHAAQNTRLLLDLLDRAIATIRQLRGTSRDAAGSARTRNFAAETAMICARGDFRQFLADQHGLEAPLTEERATQRLRSVLSIKSRTELNEDDGAAARWQQLRAAFENWKRG